MRTLPIGVLTSGLLVTALAAQDPFVDESALLARLGDASRRDAAIDELDRLGPDAVRRLIAAVPAAEPVAAATWLAAVRDLAHHAGFCYDTLAAMEVEAPEVRAELFITRAAVMPFLDAAAIPEALSNLGGAGMEIGRLDDDALRLRLAWSILQASEYARGETVLGRDADVDQLIAQLERRGDSWVYRHDATAQLLARRGADAAKAVPALLGCLRLPVFRSKRTCLLGQEAQHISCPTGPPDNRRCALAIVRIQPDGPAALEAYGYLVRHGSTRQRRDAEEAIRIRVDGAAAAVPHLVATLQGDDAAPLEAAERVELVTTLGLIGPAAAGAATLLREYAGGADARLAAVAAVALARIVPAKERR
ncbi:MAG: hypothetical protein H6838_18765 [Planctomycetes bacterium]|nr:hypothetical protein [Planctomycetota bacterium]MCB9887540.1 hypothetical protein [Planctomycetota bacterium]